MDNNTNNQQATSTVTPPVTNSASTPTAPEAGQGPVIVPPGTPTSNVTPVAPPQKHDGKNKSLIIVAVILIVLIAVLGIIYFLIIKQSNANKTVSTPPAIATPTVEPTAIPTPTDDEIMSEEVEDPTTEIDPLQQDAASL